MLQEMSSGKVREGMNGGGLPGQGSGGWAVQPQQVALMTWIGEDYGRMGMLFLRACMGQ